MKRTFTIILALFSLTSFLSAQSLNALNFDGVNDYVNIGTPLSAGTSYTKEAWIYATDGNGFRNIISSYNDFLWIRNGEISAGKFNNNAVQIVSTPVILYQWIHVAVTYNNATGIMVLYINGVQKSQATPPSNYDGGVIFIGAHLSNGTPDSFFKGMIDEVRIWNKVLLAEEVAANYNKPYAAPLPPGLIAYYRFNQGNANGINFSVTTLTDETGNFTGTLNNFALIGTSSNWVNSQVVSAVSSLTLSGADRFVVYPNPVNGKVFIRPNAVSQKPVTVKVYNNAGQEVLARTAVLSGTLQLPLVGLKKGLYFLQLTGAKGGTQTEKLVIE